MKKHRTFLRLFLGNLLVMVCIIALGGVVAYRQIDARFQQDARSSQERLAEIATRHLQALWPLDATRVQQACTGLIHDSSIRLTVVAADGTVLGESSGDPRGMRNHKTPDRPEILDALEGRIGHHVRLSDTTGVQYRYIAYPLEHEGKVQAAVRVAVPVKAIADSESFVRSALLWAAFAGLMAAVLLGLLVSWVWYAPLRRVAKAARQIASGDLSCRVRVRGGGELVELGKSLDEMRQSLVAQFETIALQGQDLQTVLATMTEGIVATDAQGRVVLMNQTAGALLAADVATAIGQPLQKSVPVLEILDFHDNISENNSIATRQYEVTTGEGRKVFEVQGAVVTANQSRIRRVLVVRDVTELSAAAAMKAQFVANASHELRTPLATIRAAVDSLALAADDREEAAKITSILDRQVARLQNMTNDLLDLHMVESGKLPLRLQDIRLGDLSHWVESTFAPLAQGNGVEFHVSADPVEYAIRSDRKLLELILRNLADNAIKFTPPGGIVRCELTSLSDGVTLRVSDTGCGIRPQDQPRVFERFFQADSARSGDTRIRGTGLGLAIVKHAADRLGARIELRSELGQGTTVTVIIP